MLCVIKILFIHSSCTNNFVEISNIRVYSNYIKWNLLYILRILYVRVRLIFFFNIEYFTLFKQNFHPPFLSHAIKNLNLFSLLLVDL